MSSSNTTNTILNEWEEVYSVRDVTSSLWTQDTPQFQTGTKYYQTYGGGPEGGYFVKDEKVWKVRRCWFQPWSVEEVPNSVLEYEPADEMAGKTARCRLIEVKVDYQTAKKKLEAEIEEEKTKYAEALKRNDIAGHSAEIVKCLRDALHNPDPMYKDICLWCIVNHFATLDTLVNLLPQETWPLRKEILHKLDEEYAEDITKPLHSSE